MTGVHHSRQGDLVGAEKGHYRRAANSLPRTGLRPWGVAFPRFLTPSGAPGSNSQRTDKPAGPRRPLLARLYALEGGAVCPIAQRVASAEHAPYSEGQCVQADVADC